MRRAVVILTLVLVAQSAHAQTGYKVARRPRMGLVLTGAGLIGLGVAVSVLIAATENFGGISPLVIVPVAGPWIGFGWDVANSKSCPLQVNTVDCQSYLVDPSVVAVGVVELVGVVLLAVGLVPQNVKTKVTINPTFAWHDGPRIAVTLPF